MKKFDLDAMLDADACAEWLGISKDRLLRKARARVIPSIRISRRILRFHPRSILEKFKPK